MATGEVEFVYKIMQNKAGNVKKIMKDKAEFVEAEFVEAKFVEAMFVEAMFVEGEVVEAEVMEQERLRVNIAKDITNIANIEAQLDKDAAKETELEAFKEFNLYKEVEELEVLNDNIKMAM